MKANLEELPGMCVETATLGDLPSYGNDKAQSSCVPCGLDGLLENICILTLLTFHQVK